MDMTPSDGPAVHRGLVASRVVEALCKGRGITVEELAESIGMKRSTLYNRLSKGNWQFTELVAAAEALNEPISSFLDGLGGRFTGASTPAGGAVGGAPTDPRTRPDTRQYRHPALAA